MDDTENSAGSSSLATRDEVDGDNVGSDDAISSSEVNKRTISLLPTSVSRQISTQQVVISAASAVRQLLDNSVDAGATSIEITTESWGVECIRVADDGTGIHEDSFPSLCSPHATSKLASFDDLLSLSTLGFRGEALNACCSLGEVTITTRREGVPVAARLTFDHSGQIVKRESVPRAIGTTVEVRSLFASLPVRRREFERTAKRDFPRLLAVVQEFALSRPGIRFNVYSKRPNLPDQHALCTAGGLSSLSDVIYNLFGGKAEKSQMVQIETTTEALDDAVREQYGIRDDEAEERVRKIWVSGFASSPEHGQGRGSADRQFIYVNGRPVDYPKVCRAVNELYQQYNRRQYPAVVLRIDMPKDWVDVNVTPDKRLVFCQQEKPLLCAVKSAMAAAFRPFQGLLTSLEERRESLSSSFNTSVREKSKKEETSSKGKKRKNFLDDEDDEEKEGDVSLMDDSNAESPRMENRRGGDILGGFDSAFGYGRDREALASVQTSIPAGFRSREMCLPSAKRAKTATPPSGTRSLESFAFKIIPHKSSTIGLEHEPPRVGLNKDLLSRLADREARVKEEEHTEMSQIVQRRREAEEEREGPMKQEVLSQAMMKREVLSQVPVPEPVENEKEIPAVDAAEHPQPPAEGQAIETRPTPRKTVYYRTEQKLKVSLKRIMSMRATSERRNGKEKEKEERQCLSSLSECIAPSNGAQAERELRMALRRADFKDMRIVGQFNNGFIITQLDSHLFIVDQHASDEKRNFERLEKTSVISSQRSVNPQRLDAGAVHEAVVRDNLNVFRASGFRFDDPPDGSGLRLVSVPMVQNINFDRSDVDELITALAETPGMMHRPTKLRKIFASKACRQSVMIGTRLHTYKMREIVHGLGDLENPWCCPHGRPTLRHLLRLEVEADEGRGETPREEDCSPADQ